MPEAPEKTISLGDQAPAFDLEDTEGARHSLPAKGDGPTAIVFTCNHCPYALAWHDRIADVARARREILWLDSVGADAIAQRGEQEVERHTPARRDVDHFSTRGRCSARRRR